VATRQSNYATVGYRTVPGRWMPWPAAGRSALRRWESNTADPDPKDRWRQYPELGSCGAVNAITGDIYG
jgi:hypothetical protein